jgi:hypothetical protein
MEIITRKDAKAAGIKFYFTGVNCVHGHVSNRYTSNTQCVECRANLSNDWYSINREAVLKKQKKWISENKYTFSVRRKKWLDENKNKISEHQKKQNIRKKNLYKTCPIYSLSSSIRSRIIDSFNNLGCKKPKKTELILGCTFLEFRVHIERQFKKGMTWENRGDWHIDHIIPLATAKTEADVIALNHFTNLRPLWARENISKGAKVLTLL